MTFSIGIALFCAGWTAGIFYITLHLKRAGLRRTQGELLLARAIGDDAMDAFAQNVRRKVLSDFSMKESRRRLVDDDDLDDFLKDLEARHP